MTASPALTLLHLSPPGNGLDTGRKRSACITARDNFRPSRCPKVDACVCWTSGSLPNLHHGRRSSPPQECPRTSFRGPTLCCLAYRTPPLVPREASPRKHSLERKCRHQSPRVRSICFRGIICFCTLGTRARPPPTSSMFGFQFVLRSEKDPLRPTGSAGRRCPPTTGDPRLVQTPCF